MPKVVHCKRSVEPFVYIGRPSMFGNPFALTNESDRSKVIEQYREYFNQRVQNEPEFKQAVLNLRGSNLGCWCAPKACHGDVILAYANN